MPIYEYKCKSCNEKFEKILSFSRMKEPLGLPCPNCNVENEIEQCFTCAAIADPFSLGRIKPSDGFREKLRNIKKAHPGSTIKDI